MTGVGTTTGPFAAPRLSLARSWVPALVSLGVAALASALRVPVVPLIATLALVALTPIARTLATRVRVWALGSLAAGGVISVVPGVPITRGTALVALTVGLAAGMAFRWRTGPSPWRPQLRQADWVALGCAIAVLGMLALPYRGAGEGGVLLDLARAFDTQSHHIMVKNLISESSAAWVTSDGSVAAWANGYPLGLHVLGAFAVLMLGISSPEYITAFALIYAVSVAISALLLALLAIDIAEATGDPRDRGRRGVAAALTALLVLPLGGLVGGMFELGHGAFLYPVVIATTASWMALAPSRGLTMGAAVLGLAAAGVVWTYPPLLGGLVIPAMVMAAEKVDRRKLWPIIAVLLLITAAAVGQLWRWRWRLDSMAEATGEFSTPVRTSLLMTAVTLILVMLALSRRVHTPVLRALAPVLGFGLASGALAALALSASFSPLQNYYVAKLLQACWIAQLPIIIGVSAWAIFHLASRYPHNARALRAAGVVGLALFLVLVPDSRHSGVAGVSLLQQRILERDRALNQVTVVDASKALGPTDDDAAVMVRPPGWFYRVSYEDPQATNWVKDGSSASHWLNSLRGVKSARQSEAARCMSGPADAGSIPCLHAWLMRYPSAKLQVVLADDSDEAAFTALSRDFPARVVLHTVDRTTRPDE